VAPLRLRDLALFLPRLGRMLASLMTDRGVPKAAKIVLAAVAVYLASPVDLIPDFIPVLGYLDDALLVAVVLDGLLNYLDRALLLKYWPGDAASLEALAAVARRLARWVPSRIKSRLFSLPAAPFPPSTPAPPSGEKAG
jgi:uncharacterized membrane protein YkvA (DUF1232 family)